VQVKTDRDGLSARVSCLCKITFQYRYRWNVKGERVDIGTYPATSLKEARDAPQARSSLIDIPPRIRQSVRRHLSTEIEHWTLYDLCRTARANFSDLSLNRTLRK